MFYLKEDKGWALYYAHIDLFSHKEEWTKVEFGENMTPKMQSIFYKEDIPVGCQEVKDGTWHISSRKGEAMVHIIGESMEIHAFDKSDPYEFQEVITSYRYSDKHRGLIGREIFSTKHHAKLTPNTFVRGDDGEPYYVSPQGESFLLSFQDEDEDFLHMVHPRVICKAEPPVIHSPLRYWSAEWSGDESSELKFRDGKIFQEDILIRMGMSVTKTTWVFDEDTQEFVAADEETSSVDLDY